MPRVFIIEDSSFVIALMNVEDPLHQRAFLIFRKLLNQFRNKIKVIIPCIVFFETLFNLLNIGLKREIIEEKLWKLLKTRDVINFALPETAMLRFASYLESLIVGLPVREELPRPASDAIIVATAVDFDGVVLTFDKKMGKIFSKNFKEIYCPLNEAEEKKFFEKLSRH